MFDLSNVWNVQRFEKNVLSKRLYRIFETEEQELLYGPFPCSVDISSRHRGITLFSLCRKARLFKEYQTAERMRAFLIFLVIIHASFGREPACSKFAYEESMLEKMVRTEFNFGTLQNEFSKLSKDVHMTMENVMGLIEEIKTERRNMLEEFHQLNTTTVEKLEEHLVRSKHVLQQKVNQIERMSSDLRDIYADLRKNITESIATPIVGFKATGMKNISPKKGDSLVFPTVLFNIHNGYKTSTGVFIAPVRGLYLFTTQICTGEDVFVSYDIIAGGEAYVRGDAGDKSWSTCNTADAFAYMDVGQTAYVNIFHIQGGKLLEDAHRQNSFSGALIKPQQ